MFKENPSLSGIDRQLSLILFNRLVFQSKQEFADYAHFPSLMSNNPISSKMPNPEKVELLGRLTEEFLPDGTGYDDFGFFLQQYEAVSEFYRNHIQGKKSLDKPECAVIIAHSLYHSHLPSGVKKLDAILDLIHDFEYNCRKGKYLDIDILLLIIIRALPPMALRGPKEDPDFLEEWNRVKLYLHQCDAFRNMYEDNPLIEELESDIDNGRIPLNRLSCLSVIAIFNEYLERASHPKEMDKDLVFFELDGLWQNYRDGKLFDADTYYRFILGGQGYDFIEYKFYPSYVKRALYHGSFQIEEKGRSFAVVHPKGSYETVMGKPVGQNHVIWYKADVDDIETPTRIQLEQFKGGKGFDLFLDTLLKIPADKTDILMETIESSETKIVDAFSKYTCVYPNPFGVYAITKEYIYLMDPAHEGHFFKVPKAIDERLDTITVDSMAGVISVGDEDNWWLGFESIALYLSPTQCEKEGVDWVDRID